MFGRTGLARLPLLLFIIVIFAAGGLLSSCGSGSGQSIPPPPPQPDFSLTVFHSSLPVEIQGVAQVNSIGIQSLNGFNGTVALSLQNLPVGVMVSPSASFTLTSGAQDLLFTASSAATAGTFTVTVNATSGSLAHSTTFNIVVAPAASFYIDLSPSSLSLSPASRSTVTVTATPITGSLPSDLIFNVTFPQNATGLSFSSTDLTTIATQFHIDVAATVVAQPIQNYALSLSASSASTGQSTVTQLLVSVASTFPPITSLTRSTFYRSEMGITGAAYDPIHRLVFAAAWQLNEVLVLSAADGSLKATIPFTEAFAVDVSPDGSTAYVTSLSANIAEIDTSLLQIRRIIYGLLPPVGGFTNDASRPLAMSNGKVLIVGPSLYVWDPVAGTLQDSNAGQFGAFGTVTRSSDHTKALISEADQGTRVAIYDANTETFNVFTTSDNDTTLNPLNVALNSDGSQIAAASADGQGVSFYNTQMQLQKTVTIAAGLNRGPDLAYSLDGQYLYALCLGVATVFDASTKNIIGVVPDPMGQGQPYAIDETGMIFSGNDLGLEFFDVSDPGFVRYPIPLFNGGVTPELLNTTGTTLATLGGSGFSSGDQYHVYFGAAPASALTQAGTDLSFISSNQLQATATAGNQPGVVNVTLTRSDGWAQIAPYAASFGPHIMMIDGNSGPSQGGSTIVIYGYGLGGSNTQVTIGGASATVSQYIAPGAGSPGSPMNLLYVTTPSGTPGPADVTVSTPSGSDTLSGGFQYLAASDTYAKAGLLSHILYDQPRQLLYASNTTQNRIEVFSLASKSFASPIPVGSGPLGIAMTADGSTLAVVNAGDGTVSLINLNSGATTATYPVLTSGDKDSICGGVAYEVTPAGPHGMIVAVDCVNLEENGYVHYVNLTNGSLDCSSLPQCDGSGNLQYGFQPKMLTSSPDGKIVAMADTVVPGYANGGGQLTVLNLNTNTLSQGGGTDGDVAFDNDGNLIAGGYGIYDSLVNTVAVPQDIGYLGAGGLSLGTLVGERLDPSGSLLFVPQQTIFAPTRGIDVFDVHRQRLAMRIALPVTIPAGAMSSMAIDETGTKLFVLTQSGITLVQLQALPLSIGSVTPAQASVGSQITIRGSGFTTASTVKIGSASAISTFVDPSTLHVIVPSLSPGPARVTVSNLAASYSLDASFAVQ